MPVGFNEYSTSMFTYTIEWSPEYVKLYVNNQLYGQTSPTDGFVPTESAFHLIANTAVGGDWPGSPDDTTVFPAYMKIDYIRVYQKQ
jgi:beta-glucanase (GH16 family)